MKILSVVALLFAPAFSVSLKEKLQATAMSMQDSYGQGVEEVSNLEDLPFIAVGDQDYKVLGADEPCCHVQGEPLDPTKIIPTETFEITYVYYKAEPGPTGPAGP